MNRKKPPASLGPSKKPSSLDGSPDRPDAGGFLIAGIGASAGGLEALRQLLSSLDRDTGIAFVLIQHLDPKHESMSAEILSRCTPLPVIEVSDGMGVEPNHVYVIPANFGMEISKGVLRLMPRSDDRGQPRVIDIFLRSLAKDRKNLAVGVILSGTGSDGTEGLISIKAEGGITFAQSPKSAKFDDMPKSAIASGSVDLVLPPQEIAEELKRVSRHPLLALSRSRIEILDEDEASLPPDSLSQIFQLLRNICHVDFTHYKSSTIQRRIERRILLNRAKDLAAYVKFLSENPLEIKALYADILIHVTGFFRDPEAFEAIGHEVFPELLKDRPLGVPIRVWVPGCSTGEEVYSIAILLLEYLGGRVSNIPVQIFASDISEQAIQTARNGEYPDTIARDVSPERLNRFFLKLDNGYYKVSKSVRDICIFSRHDITVDPPFAKIDLISCRNLLIYLTGVLQKQVIPIFHYALNPKGFLWLGRSETIGGFSNLFTPIDKANKIYTRKSAPITLNLQFPARTYVPGKQEIVRKPPAFIRPAIDAQKLTDLALQAEYPGVLIDDELDILQFRGRTAPFIEPAAGAASYHLLKMVHPDFAPDLRRLIQEARKLEAPVRKEGLHLKDGRRGLVFNLKVIPVKPSPASKDRYFFILFENALELDSSGKQGKARRGGKAVPARSLKAGTDPHLAELQQELMSNQEYQRSLIERHEIAQEDLTSANEELQSANEELQSTNEELETAKEELQSSNEELTTVNDELQSRSQEQVQLSNDLINLLGSVEIPILMLGSDHRIRRFTPLAAKALNLISTDVGRPISDLKLNFTSPGIDLELDRLVSEVLDTTASRELEVQDREGRWYRLQVRPYKTIDRRIDGAVLALVDIDALKQSLKEVRAARAEAEKANQAKDLFLAMLSHELRTPLTSILSRAQMLRRGIFDPEKAKKGLAIIEESANAQAQLINDLLDVSRIIAGKLSLEFHEVNPDSILRAAIEAVRSTAEHKSIRIETDFESDLGTIMADPVRLQQIFWNLLTNAVKFSAPGSRISVKLGRETDKAGRKAQVRVQVIDYGKGIDADFLPHIFDRFSQEDSSSVKVHGGLGLGLAIVRNLVDLHGGTIRAESAGEKRGATFTVLLPIRSDRPIPERPVSAGEAMTDGIRLDGIRVLIVDDESNIREAFSELLRAMGAETVAASSATEGLALVRRFKPDVLVSDIAMPGEDGYSLIRKIRDLAVEEGRNTPSIAITAFAGADDVRRAISSGFQAHLAKPLDSQRLAELIAKLAAHPESRPE